MQIFYALSEYSPLITIGLIVAVGVLFVMVVIITYLISKMHDRMYRFFGGRSKRRNMEAMLDEYLQKVSRIDMKYNESLALIDDINARMVTCIRKIGVVRYNPFEEMGGDLSFALALLDENEDGIVISTIHARDASYTYAKQVLGGKSSHELTEEELEAIKVALDWKPIVDMGIHRVKLDKRLNDLKSRQRELRKAHDANAPTPTPEKPAKPRKQSRATVRLKANRKKVLGKAVVNSAVGAAKTVRRWPADALSPETGQQPAREPVPQVSAPEVIEQEASPPETAADTAAADEALANQRAVEMLQEKLRRHEAQEEKEPTDE